VESINQPHPIPNNWSWVRFGNIVDFSAGRTPSRNDASFWNTGDYPWVSIADMEDGKVIESTKETVSEKARKVAFKSEPEQPGTMIMSFKLTIGKIARLGILAFHNEAIISIRPTLADLDPYLFKVLPDLARGGDTKGAIKGATLNRESISNILTPLPPLAEQHRIVAKVDELMALLDRLEAARTAREATRDRLTAASLARLTTSDTSAQQFPAHARFALDALPALTARPDQIKALRQTILNLAVRGKLVEQDPTDKPASGLLEAIRSEKKEATKRRAEPDMTLVDFSIPSHWVWQSLDTILTDGPHNGLSPRKSERTDTPKAITLTATTTGTFDARQFKHVDVNGSDAARYWLEPGDLLFQRGNTREYVGMAAVYDGPTKQFLFPDLIMRVRISQHMDLRFVHLWCIAPFARHFLSSNATGAQQTMPKINQGILRALPIPLPPLAEQHRIVAKVDALMALCDRLEAALTTTDTTRARLLESLLRETLAAESPRELEAVG